MEPGRVRPLGEADLDFAIQAAGGRRAHANTDQRTEFGADYRLGAAIIELKALDDEGFSKSSRQAKLAELFRAHFPARPVIVLDRNLLPADDQHRFNRIIEGPIKTAVGKANKQLKQSRREQPDATRSVLLFVNNGYTTLTHEDLKEIVGHRIRNDTTEIDAAIVAGAYYHSDGFDSFFLWPFDEIPININKRFSEYERLKAGWNMLADRFMTDAVRGNLGSRLERGPVVDTQFDIDGVTFIRPAPAIGDQSAFFIHGRPRKDSTGSKHCSPVATTFPLLSESQWRHVLQRCAKPNCLTHSYEAWRQMQTDAMSGSQALKPLVEIRITTGGWEAWCRSQSRIESTPSVFDYANQIFCDRVSILLREARESRENSILPARYVWVVTEVIEQDRANDISHIAVVRERPNAPAAIRPIVEDARIFHEHALAVGAAYAVRENCDSILWSKDTTYAWI